MMADDKNVERKDYSSTPLPLPDMGYGTRIHETTVTDDAGNKYTGTGWTRDEADQAAGEKMNRGEKD
jgi:hypothetical protein